MVAKRICTVAQAELTLVRVTCGYCHRPVETTVEDLPDLFPEGICKLCTESVHTQAGMAKDADDPLKLLRAAWRRLDKLKGEFTLEFIVPESEETGK